MVQLSRVNLGPSHAWASVSAQIVAVVAGVALDVVAMLIVGCRSCCVAVVRRTTMTACDEHLGGVSGAQVAVASLVSGELKLVHRRQLS